MSEVIVIGCVASLFALRVEWALKLKDVVDYEYINEDLKNKSPLLLKHNPVYKKVPVLVHQDKYSVPDSLVILEYIDDSWKHNPLLPQHPYDRAMARFWAKFIDEKCLMIAYKAFISQGEEKEKAIEAVLESLSFLEKQLEGNNFFGGEHVGFLDLVAGWIPIWLKVWEEVGDMKLLHPEKFPNLCKWAENFVEIATIKEYIPAKQYLVDFYTTVLVHFRSLDSTKP